MSFIHIPQKKNIKFHIIILNLLLVIIYLLFKVNRIAEHNEKKIN